MMEQVLIEIARCDREIERIRNEPSTGPAWLPAMGECDWNCEKALILKEARA